METDRKMFSPTQKPVTTQSEEAYRQLRADIIEGQFEAGQRLRIEALRKQYSIGPTPLREALNRLSADGFVLVEGQRGFTVTPLTLEDLEDVTQMRVLLENRALERSIESGNDDWEAQLVAAFHGLSLIETSPGARDLEEWERRNAKFHHALIGACHSRWLKRFANILYDQHRRYRHLARAHLGERDIHAEHRAICEAALAREAEKACKANESHIMGTVETLRKLLPDSVTG
jgi:DNA-binding GntR family transcriptional regulator